MGPGHEPWSSTPGDDTIGRIDCPQRERAAAYRAGELVAFPTETVYGLGGDATNDARRRAHFRRERPAALQPADRACSGPRRGGERWPCSTTARAGSPARFWPGPLTLVLPRRPKRGVAAGERRARHGGVRAPAHPVAQALLRAAGRPIAAPVGQPLRPGQPDDGGACAAEFAAATDGPAPAIDPRWRPLSRSAVEIRRCST